MHAGRRHAHIDHHELLVTRATQRKREAARKVVRHRRRELRARQHGIRALIVAFRGAVSHISKQARARREGGGEGLVISIWKKKGRAGRGGAPVEIARDENGDAGFRVRLVSRTMEQHRGAQPALRVAHVV